MFNKNFFKAISSSNIVELAGTKNHFIVSISETPESYSEMFVLDNGIAISFNHIRTHTFPSPPIKDMTSPHNYLFINICLKGKCEIRLPNQNFMVLSNNRLSLSSELPISDLFFPDSFYNGITVYINTDKLNDYPNNFLQLFGINLSLFLEKFHYNKNSYYNFTTKHISSFSEYLWSKKIQII